MDIILRVKTAEEGATTHAINDGRRELPLIVVCRYGSVSAFLNSCPHAGVRLDFNNGSLLDATGTLLQCSLHGALFEPGSGRCVAGPCKGSRLVRIASRVEADGTLVVENPEKIPARAFQSRF
jgi:nitrite reductase/ring-hydroxylating ferredoxin subunit